MASKEDYIVHKPAELSTVHKRRQEEIRAGAITRYWMLPKYDGCCTVIKLLPSGGYEIMSRVGKGPYPSMEAAAREAASTLSGLIRHHGGLVVIGEAWSPDYPHNEISGEFRRQVESDWLNLMAFDCISLADFEAGKCDMPYRARRAMLGDFEKAREHKAKAIELAPEENKRSYSDWLDEVDRKAVEKHAAEQK